MGATSKRGEFDETLDANVTRAKVVRRPRHPLGPRLDLIALRKGIGRSQEEVAEAAQMTLDQVARLEQHGDVELPALRRYVRALGADLELVVVLKTGHRMRLDF